MHFEEDISIKIRDEATSLRDPRKRALLSNNFQPDTIFDVEAGNTFDATLEKKFSRDLVRFILHEYMTGLHWIPDGLFSQRDLDSPFTPQFKKAIKEELDTNGHLIHEMYDGFFPDKSKVAENHKENCKIFKDKFVNEEFSPKTFIRYCAIVGFSAGLSYLYGALLAPYQSVLALITAIQEVKCVENIGDDIWIEIQDWLELHEYELKSKMLRKKLIKHAKNHYML